MTGSDDNAVTDVAARFLVAFIARDPDALVASADPSIEVRPLRITQQPAYRGHSGLAAWLEAVANLPDPPSFEVEDLEALDAGRTLARVRVRIAGHRSGRF